MQYDIQYRVDEKNRVVVATANFEDEIERLFEKKVGVPICEFYGNLYFNINKKCFRRFTRVIARCHPDDTFDVEVGKKICRQKLKDKFYKQLNWCVSEFIKHYSILIQNGRNFLGDIDAHK